MANKKKKKKQSLVNWPFVIIASLILSVASVITMADHLSLPSFIPTWEEVGDTIEDITEDIAKDHDIPMVKNDKELAVHFIDVGQGDSILVQYDGMNMLIDAGDTHASDEVMGYLNNHSVAKIDLLVVTHPDSDHIGSMSKVIDNYDIGSVYMSPLPDELVPTTNVYTNMLLAMNRKGLKINLADAGDTIKFGNLNLECVAPEGEFASKNNTSLAFKMTYGEISFLFTGDMQKESEKCTLKAGYDISATVLKIGHHGAKTSTHAEFLDAVSPKYAVISVGEDNKYGHPTDEVLNALTERGITVYRTDWDGDVVMITDGKELDITPKK